MTTAPSPTRGRPRDPHVEDRVYEAALEVYSERGWSGFTLDAVARTAKVGNAAIYRRWTSKEQLLAQAVQAKALALEPVDTGSSRDDLLALARHFLLGYHVPAGVAGLRMALDARSNPQLAEAFEADRDGPRRTTALAVVRRAVARGDLVPGTTPGTVLEVLAGATLAHVLYAPRSAEGTHDATTPPEERFLARLVDGLLRPTG